MADFPDTLTIDVEFPDLDVDVIASYPGQNGVATTPLTLITTVGIGAPGPAGPPPTLAIGSVTSGTTPAVSIDQTAPGVYELDFVLKEGPPGANSTVPGPANSLSIGSVTSGPTPSASITGAAPNQILNLVLQPGAASTVPGPANTLSIGSVTSGPANATITGASPNQTLNLTLPPGANGVTPTIVSGTITTLPSGSSATASLTPTGTPNEYALNLGLPAGPAGSGTGDVIGPASATDGNIPLFDGATGKLLKNSTVSPASFATAAQGAKADSAVQPGTAALTGTPTAPTAAADTNTTQIATTAFVLGQAGAATPVVNGTGAAGTSPRYSRQDHVHPTDTTRAALASPTFTGTPAAPTATAGTNTTQLATTAFVTTAVSTKANIASPTFTGTPAAPTATAGTSTTQLATTAFVTTADNLKANLASPAFTGTPTAPTAAGGTNTTQLATTAFVGSAVSAAALIKAAGSDWRTGTDDAKYTTVKSAVDGGAFVSQSVTGSTTLDFNSAWNWSLTLTGNLTLEVPSNMKEGQSGFLFFIQDGTGSRTISISSSIVKSGTYTLSTAANAVDSCGYVVRGGVLHLFPLIKGMSL